MSKELWINWLETAQEEYTTCAISESQFRDRMRELGLPEDDIEGQLEELEPERLQNEEYNGQFGVGA